MAGVQKDLIEPLVWQLNRQDGRALPTLQDSLWASQIYKHAPSQRQIDGVADAQATSSCAADACWGNARGGLDARSPTSELMGISPALPHREPLQPRQMRGPDTPGHAEAVRF